MGHFTEEEKNFLLALLLRAVSADELVHHRESVYIKRVIHQLEIPEETIENLPKESSDISIPKSEKKRMTMLYYLLFLLQSDGSIGSQEEKLAIAAGFELGFNEVMVRNMVMEMRKNLGKQMGTEALLKHIRAYLN
jgi:hypothetical protein